MLWKGFQRPKRLEFERETLTERFGRFYAQPFERGFGTTIGNALRRVLLSSIEGAAITAVKIDGVLHEFSPIPGVVEDATDIILNLKQIPLKLHVDHTKTLTLRVDKAGRSPRARHPGGRRRRDPRARRPHRDGRRGRQAPHGDADEARPRLRRGRQELRRGSRHRLDPDRLGALADQEGQLPGRGGAPGPDDRLRQADGGRVDQRLDQRARRRVARGEADPRPPEHLHQPRGRRRAAGRSVGRSAAHGRQQREPRQERRGARAVGPVVQLPQEREHPHDSRAGAEDRSRDAQDEELRAQEPERDQGNPPHDGPEPRHARRPARLRRESGAGIGDSARIPSGSHQ